jgi:hypothetical protein
MLVFQANDGFLWADVTPIAESLWYQGDFDLYAIYDDESEHLIESEREFVSVIKEKTRVCIELCPIEEIKQLN